MNPSINALINESIVTICAQIDPNLTCHQTSIAYIQALLMPYADAIEPANDINSIKQWIPAVLPGELGRGILSKIIERATAKPEDATIVNDTKSDIITQMITNILRQASAWTRNVSDIRIFPWDIQGGISDDPELSAVFGITKDDRQLPVTITIGPQEFIHMLSSEFVAGLLLFSSPNVGNYDLGVTIFGVSLTFDYVVPMEEDADNRFIFDPDHNQNYSVTVDRKYGFETPDFMQGFSTGALWAGIDHHKYWTRLAHYTFDETTHEQIATEITF